MKAFRGEILSVPDDPASAGAEAVRHFEDGLLVVEDGLVIACGAHADLAERFADVAAERAARVALVETLEKLEPGHQQPEALAKAKADLAAMDAGAGGAT